MIPFLADLWWPCPDAHSVSFHDSQVPAPKEFRMTTAATISWELLPGLAHEIALGASGPAWCLGLERCLNAVVIRSIAGMEAIGTTSPERP